MNLSTTDDFHTLLTQSVPLLDVRAEIEFIEGSFPCSENSPILDSIERQQVGTCYKKFGQEKAVELGHQLVSGQNRIEKIQKWVDFCKRNPNAHVICFRGGLRSQTAQKWLFENGIHIPRIISGYKGFRTWALQELDGISVSATFRLISGKTGSGKTTMVQRLIPRKATIDLEGIAKHRGSAFGYLEPQPTPSNFEHEMLKQLLHVKEKFSDSPIHLEDESRLIGKRALPKLFFEQMRKSSVVLIEEKLENRVNNILYDYVISAKDKALIFQTFRENTMAITKKMGLERVVEIIDDIKNAEVDFLQDKGFEKNRVWIEKLLLWYYDPMYLQNLEKRNPHIEFRGTSLEVFEYLCE